ncbi:hypothetical protein VT52_019755 [Streptomyces malaysiense]|uniref:Polysaccharide deacetylase n=1 Tax=Streptomyces malaysiense TaxID=1428626 RepID=A0A1J4Q0R3_9ACTN|nr:hypothetical protein [Streptomyces malaysiense]OIK25974.1 hypothetical protein VT52_019755 [Streptomyces malaysiense]
MPSVSAWVLAAVLLLTGCAQPVVPIERLGRKAAEGVRPHGRPLAAPPSGRALPPVVDHVATRDRVVFLTRDDADRDPRRTATPREPRLPVRRFTTGLRPLAGRPYATQRAALCARRTRLLRPPRGAYDSTTLRAAADCGVAAVVLWRATLAPAGLTYSRGPHHLRRGDIVRLAPGAPAARLLGVLRERNLTAARLEDYL